MRRRRAIPLAMATLAAVGGVVVPVDSAMAAAPGNLYVDNRTGSNCWDGGMGSAAEPFCSLGAAAAVVSAGQTVLVSGAFQEQLTIAKSGTSGSPIIFEANPAAPQGSVGIYGSGAGITISGQHDVSVAGIQIAGNSNTGITITNSSHVTLDGTSTTEGDGVGIRLVGVSDSSLTGVSSTFNDGGGISLDATTTGVLIRSATVQGDGRLTQVGGLDIAGPSNTVVDSEFLGNGTGIMLRDGADGTVIANNVISSNWDAGIDNVDADGTRIANNLVEHNCAGIQVRGASAGVSVENTIAAFNKAANAPCSTAVRNQLNIGVYDGATSSTTVDYNLVHMTDAAEDSYAWGTPVDSLAAFQTASGQGAHDLDADPVLDRSNVPMSGSPAIDSANSAAPGVQPTDAAGGGAVDDPQVADSGAGPVSYRDRGARELDEPPTAVLQVTGTAPTSSTGWQFTADASTSKFPWSPASSYTFDFGDGTAPVTQPTPVAEHGYTQLGTHLVTLTVKDAAGAQNTTTARAEAGGRYTPAGPTRVLDTRSKIGVPTTTPVPAGGTVSLQIAGVDGVPATGVTAVVLNVTAAASTSSGYLTVYPDGQSRPSTSNLDWTTANATIANLVTVQVLNGRVDLYNGSAGTVHIIADLDGYFSADGTASAYVPTDPARLLDTRNRTGVPTTSPVPAGGTVNLQVAGAGGVPATGVTAVVLNVTAAATTTSGYLTVYPDGQPRPTASNLNWTTANQTIANLVTVPVINGRVDLYNGSVGTAHFIADVAGYYLAGDAPDSDRSTIYEPNNPIRVLDTRTGTGTGVVKPLGPGATLTLSLAATPVFYQTGTNAALLNVTIATPTSTGYLTVYPDGHPRPTASNLNWIGGQTIANLVSVAVPANGKIDLYNGGGGTVNVVVDLEGSYRN